jgi:hypothetical protein
VHVIATETLEIAAFAEPNSAEVDPLEASNGSRRKFK